MKNFLIGAILLIAALVMCLSASATFLGQGIAGYLLINLAIVAFAAHLLPKFFAPKRPEIIYWVEFVLGIVGLLAFVLFGLSTGLNNAVLQRIGLWIVLNSLVIGGIGAIYSIVPWVKKLPADAKILASEQELEAANPCDASSEKAMGWTDVV